MRLHLVRHLAPLVAQGTCYGRTDLAVDAAAQARAVPALRARLPAGVPVFSSPLVRCASLALALALAREADVRIDARLLELDFGNWEMRSWDQIARLDIDAWAADVATYRPGGGESVTEMALRIDAFYTALMGETWPEVVIVCHAGAMRLLSARQAGLSPAEMAREAAQQPHAIGYGEIIVLDCV